MTAYEKPAGVQSRHLGIGLVATRSHGVIMPSRGHHGQTRSEGNQQVLLGHQGPTAVQADRESASHLEVSFYRLCRNLVVVSRRGQKSSKGNQGVTLRHVTT